MRAGCFTLVFFATVPWQWGFVVLFGFGFGIFCFLFAFDSLFLPEVPRFFTRELTSLLHQLQFCGQSARSIVHRHYSCSVASEFDPKSLLGRGVLGRVFSHCGQHALNSDYAEQRLIQNHWKTISSLENTCMQCHQQFKCKLRNAKKFRHALVPLQQFAMFSSLSSILHWLLKISPFVFAKATLPSLSELKVGAFHVLQPPAEAGISNHVGEGLFSFRKFKFYYTEDWMLSSVKLRDHYIYKYSNTLFTSSTRKRWFGPPEGSKNQIFDFACAFGLSLDFGPHFQPSFILVLALLPFRMEPGVASTRLMNFWLKHRMVPLTKRNWCWNSLEEVPYPNLIQQKCPAYICSNIAWHVEQSSFDWFWRNSSL